MKNCIIIKTKDNPIVIEVPVYTKDDCIHALGKTLRIDIGNIEQLSASMSYGIYGVRELTPSLIDVATNPVNDIGYTHTLEVEYGKLI